MKIGIVGCGIVGGALKFGFEKLDHEVRVHDIKLGTEISDLFNTEVMYICVPTPMNEDGSCNTSIVESVLQDIENAEKSLYTKYHGTVVIKSTVPPGFTADMCEKYNRDFLFSPEFLRERCAVMDFVENQKLLVIGSNKFGNTPHNNEVIESHGKYPQKIVFCDTTEAELIKYYHNCLGALRVTFANEFYDLCKKLGANYRDVKEAVLHSSSLPDIYLDVNENVRGYSSICWNKDIPALINLAEKLGVNLPLLNNIPVSNNLHKKTPFSGTRE